MIQKKGVEQERIEEKERVVAASPRAAPRHARSEGGERTRNKSRAWSKDSDANDVNAAKSTVMHGKNVGDILTSGTSEKNGIVRMALFGQSYRRVARAINVGGTRNEGQFPTGMYKTP